MRKGSPGRGEARTPQAGAEEQNQPKIMGGDGLPWS